MSPTFARLKNEQSAALRQINSLPIHERVALLIAAENDVLVEAEDEKTHPLTEDKFSPEEKISLKNHLLDGGGVTDDKSLCIEFMNALLDENWGVFFKQFPHVVKCYLKSKGIVLATKQGEGVILNNVGPAATHKLQTIAFDPEPKGD